MLSDDGCAPCPTNSEHGPPPTVTTAYQHPPERLQALYSFPMVSKEAAIISGLVGVAEDEVQLELNG